MPLASDVIGSGRDRQGASVDEAKVTPVGFERGVDRCRYLANCNRGRWGRQAGYMGINKV